LAEVSTATEVGRRGSVRERLALRQCRWSVHTAEEMFGRGRAHGKGAGLRPRSAKRSRSEEPEGPGQQAGPKLTRQTSDEPSTKLARQASDGQSTTVTRQASAAASLQLERADSFADLCKDVSAGSESVEWEGALLSPLPGSAKDAGVSGAVSVSLIRTRSQGLREVGSVRKSDDADLESSKQLPASPTAETLTSSAAAAPSTDADVSVIAPLTFKAKEATPDGTHSAPPPPRLSTVLSGV